MEQTQASAEPTGLKAPLFGSLLTQMAKDQRWVVLDLGAANGEIINLLSKYRCSLDIADLPTALETMRHIDDPDLLQALAEKLIPRRESEKVDIVLCWDLFNYLNTKAIAAVMAAITARARPGAFIHALITFSSTHMAAQPSRIGVLDSEHLILHRTSNAERHAPQYSPKVLWEAMPGYDLEKAMMLRNGMQEYLFRVMRPGELARNNVTQVQKLDCPESQMVNIKQFM